MTTHTTPADQLTIEDKRSIAYFWQTKGDLERWVDWEGKLPSIERETPHLAKAWRDYKASVAILDLVVQTMREEADRE